MIRHSHRLLDPVMLFCHRLCRLAALLLCLLPIGTDLFAQTFTNPRRIPLAQNPALALAADLNHDGRIDLVYAIDAGANMVFHTLLLQADTSYRDVQTITVSNLQSHCIVADVNSDSNPDIVCGTSGNSSVPSPQSSNMAVLLGRGDGTFSNPIFSQVNSHDGSTYWPLAVGDFNHDGQPDLILGPVLGYQYSIAVLYGDGTGNFAIASSIPISSQVVSAQLADLNGDGNLDLLARAGAGYNDLVLLGNASGSFTVSQSLPATGMLQDVDGDGHLDYLGGTNGRLQILHGNADGSFDTTTPLLDQTFTPDPDIMGDGAYFDGVIAYRDLNGDGIPDILAGSGDGITVLLGQAGPRFSVASHTSAAQNFDFTTSITSATAMDLDGDGHLDLLTSGPLGLYILYGRPDATFASTAVYESGRNVTNGTVADFNEDGVPDVVTTGDTTLFLTLGRGDGTFQPAQAIPNSAVTSQGLLPYKATFIVHGDFNGDGHQDLLVPVFTDLLASKSYLFLGNGDGTFKAPLPGPTISSAEQRGVVDLNRDGVDDLAISIPQPFGGTLVANLFHHDGSFTQQSTDFGYPIWSLGDINGDGKPDLLVASGSFVAIRPGNGDGTFQPIQYVLHVGELSQPNSVNSILVADFDGDKHNDIAAVITRVSGNTYTHTLERFYSDGYPNFSPAPSTQLSQTDYTTLLAADLNGDHLSDILLAETGGIEAVGNGNIAFYTSNPDRSLSSEHVLIAGPNLAFPTAVDVNRDGRLDLLVGNGLGFGDDRGFAGYTNTFTVLLNQGNLPQATGSLIATPEPSRLHTSFQLTATLTPPPNSPGVLTGSITFSIDGAVLGSAPLLNNVATLAAPATLARGSHSLSATWPGQPAAGTAPALGPLTLAGTHTVVGLPSTTTLSASATSVPAGTPITFTATTTVPGGPAPDLTKLQVLEGTTALQPTSTIAANSLTTTVILPPGTHTLTAVFAGDTAAEPSSSSPITITVAAAPTTLTLGPASGIAFQDVSVVATAVFTPPPATPPGGTVTFTINGQPLGTAQLSPSNTATTTFNQPAGTYALHAAYTPASGSVSAATGNGTLTIARAPVALSFTSPLIPAPAGQSTPVVLSASFNDLTARHLATGGILPTIDGKAQPLLPLPVSPAFTYTVAGLAPGMHNVTLTYPGDANFLPATTATALLTILHRDFAFSGTQTLTVQTEHYRGLPATLTSIGDFAGPVALSCANLPIYASCRFSQAPVTLTAGSAASFTVTFDTSNLPGYLASTQDQHAHRILAAVLCPLALFPLALVTRRRNPSILVLLLSIAAVALTGCSGLYPAHTPPGTYAVQVVGQSADGTIIHAQPITLVVTP